MVITAVNVPEKAYATMGKTEAGAKNAKERRRERMKSSVRMVELRMDTTAKSVQEKAYVNITDSEAAAKNVEVRVSVSTVVIGAIARNVSDIGKNNRLMRNKQFRLLVSRCKYSCMYSRLYLLNMLSCS
mmetsp:Transcript_19596/g.23803  ORF Transcript_19596/g.23803 Transcript_19596/m.23803 type:complete len:129 (+) Transcript_19596:678-1064(+)